MIIIGLFVFITLVLQTVPSYHQIQRNILLAVNLPQLQERLFNNVSVTVVKRYTEPVSLWKVHPENDRILFQASFKPEIDASLPPKRILLNQGLAGWSVRGGKQVFVDNKCPVQHCEVYDDYKGEIVDARMFKEIELNSMMLQEALASVPRTPEQVWIMFGLESPEATPSYQGLNNIVNWTATYRYDSTLITPYDKFQVYENFTKISDYKPDRNYAKGRKKLAAIFVSNCYASNDRLNYVNELQKHMQLDFYGNCGTLTCDRSHTDDCFQKLKQDYKFYLSFENANCRDYITEKLFLNALR